MREEELVHYLANIIFISGVDGNLNPTEAKAIECVRLEIGAGEEAKAAAGPVDQGMAAVAAGVLEGPHLAPLVAHQKEGMARHRHDVAGVGDLVASPDIEPGRSQPAPILERTGLG